MDYIKFTVHLTTTIIALEFFLLVWLVWKFIKKASKVSVMPLFLSCLPGLWVFIYSILTWIGAIQIVFPLEWVVITRATMMMLMGSPVWILLALSNLPCTECIYGIERRSK